MLLDSGAEASLINSQGITAMKDMITCFPPLPASVSIRMVAANGTTAQATAEKAAQYASKVQDLEDRVRVLERIVTDKGYDVATQIEALRDQRSVEERDGGVALDIKQGERA